MPLDQVDNFVRTTLSASVDASQTTIPVTDASIFPATSNGEYNLVLWDADNHIRPDEDPDVEIVRVTAVDTTNNELTVTRGQEGTSGASHPDNSAIQLAATAKMYSDIETGLNEKLSLDGSDTMSGNLSLATGQAIEDGGGTERLLLNTASTTIKGESGSNMAFFDESQGRIDFSAGANDLRLATGQAIEDGSGANRFEITDTNLTAVYNGDGERLVHGSIDRFGLRAYSTTPIQIEDQEGGFVAVEYQPSASVGTLELTNADLQMGGHQIQETGNLKWSDSDGDGSTWNLYNTGDDEWMRWFAPTSSERFRIEDSGDVVAWDSAGNKTVLT